MKWVYLLSILSNIKLVSWIALLGAVIYGAILSAEAIDRARWNEYKLATRAKKYAIIAWIHAIVFALIVVLTPSRSSLIKSYFIIKGQEIVDSKQTSTTVDSLLKVLHSELHELKIKITGGEK